MNKRDKKRRLTLHRETLLRLEERNLSGAGVVYADPVKLSRDTLCTSPLCMETTCNCAETVR